MVDLHLLIPKLQQTRCYQFHSFFVYLDNYVAFMKTLCFKYDLLISPYLSLFNKRHHVAMNVLILNYSVSLQISSSCISSIKAVLIKLSF